MSKYFCVQVNIARKDGGQMDNTTKHLIGKIKNEIDCENLIASGKVHENENFLNFLKTCEINTFIAITKFTEPVILNMFDIYGGIYEITEKQIDFQVKILFFRLKNPELISKNDITDCRIVFTQAYYTENNILNDIYHEYRLGLFLKTFDKEKIYNMSYVENNLAKTKLFAYQRHNMSHIMSLEQNPIVVHMHTNGNTYLHFENDVNYDFTENKFIRFDEIPTHKIYGGLVMDETGLGKTYQMILLTVEDLAKSTLIVVPDHIIDHWKKQFETHLTIPLTDLVNVNLITFSEFRTCKNIGSYDRVIVDEIHELYRDDLMKNKSSKPYEHFKKLIDVKAKYRWAITATPFVTDGSLFCLLQYFVGTTLSNEKIVHLPSLQNELIKLFIKNTKKNTKKELNLPPVQIEEIRFNLDALQDAMYRADKIADERNLLRLRQLVCDIAMRYDNNSAENIVMTPTQLKEFVSEKYRTDYETKVEEKNRLLEQVKNLQKKYMEAHKHRFFNMGETSDFQEFEDPEFDEFRYMPKSMMSELREQKPSQAKHALDFLDKHEYIQRMKTLERMISHKEEEITRHRNAYEYYVSKISTITNMMEQPKKMETLPDSSSAMNETNDDEDDEDDFDPDKNCPICFSKFTGSIAYLKKCTHFFCMTCIHTLTKNVDNFKCPYCRMDHNKKNDVNIVKNVVDITTSSKSLELIKIVKNTSDRFILFTQFDKFIPSLQSILERNDIKSATYKKFKNCDQAQKADIQVVILSSNENSSGIDMSAISKVIIFEPFEDHYYCKEIEKQIIGRCDRIGQKNVVVVYRLICMNTIEEEIYSNFEQLNPDKVLV